jgi:hypothetical protein
VRSELRPGPRRGLRGRDTGRARRLSPLRRCKPARVGTASQDGAPTLPHANVGPGGDKEQPTLCRPRRATVIPVTESTLRLPMRANERGAAYGRVPCHFAQQARSNPALRTHTNHHAPAVLLWCNALPGEVSWWPLWRGSLDGMQGVRGSNPLSSTTTTPQVKGLPFLQRRFLPLPDCPIRATRVPLGAGGGVSVRAAAASISSSNAAAMAASRPAITCW